MDTLEGLYFVSYWLPFLLWRYIDTGKQTWRGGGKKRATPRTNEWSKKKEKYVEQGVARMDWLMRSQTKRES
jgi:hypothetical protein